MKLVYALFLAAGTLAVPVGMTASLVLLHTLRKRHPAVLEEVDPAGFRTFYLPSQLRFMAYVARGGLKPLRDKRVNLCLSICGVCLGLVLIQLFLATFVRIG